MLRPRLRLIELYPNNSSVTLNGSVFNITGGTQAGRNLFHSFQQFSVPTGGTASFNNGLDIQNIISRVTGGTVSNIDGLIRASGMANLFVINPSGIIFGPNASLNIGGSFLATTASSLKFADGFEFSATAPQTTPLLTISVPIGLQYGGNQGSILSQSQLTNNSSETFGLQVQPGKTLALVGGDVSIDGGIIFAPSGRVDLGGLAGAGYIKLNADNTNLQLSYPEGVPRADISFNNGAIVDVSGGGGGSIVVNARNIEILQGSTLVAGIKGLGGIGTKAGDVTLNATGEITLSQLSSIVNQVYPNAIGDSGDINIAAGAFNITDGSSLGDITLGQGNAGNVNINVRGAVKIAAGNDGSSSGVFSIVSSGAIGNAGNIKIIAQSLSLNGGLSFKQGAFLNTSSDGQGNAGSITIEANNDVSLTNSGIFSVYLGGQVGNSGDINIRAKSVSLTDGSIVTNTNAGQGKPANIQVSASDFINISGINSLNGISTELETGSVAVSQGHGGDITLNTTRFLISDGAALDAGTESNGNSGNITVNAKTFEAVGGGQLITSTSGSGNGGNITLNVTDSVALSGSDSTFNDRIARFGRAIVGRNGNESPASGLFANTAPSSTGQGGNLSITTGQLIVKNDAQVAVNSEGLGKAGNLEISARSIQLDNQGKLTSQTTSSNGGNIILQLQDLLLLRHNSQISSTAGTAEARGDGGNISINAPNGFLVAVKGENSDITANAFNGSGGRVVINATGILGIAPVSRQDLERLRPLDLDPSQLSTNDITAISQQNPLLSGTVQINTPDIDPGRGLVPLPTVTEEVPRLVSSNCRDFNEINGGSSFTVTGRGGLPPNPTEPLTSDVVWSDTRPLVTITQQHQRRTHAAKPRSKPQAIAIVPATAWVINGNGEVKLISSAINATFLSTPVSCPAR